MGVANSEAKLYDEELQQLAAVGLCRECGVCGAGGVVWRKAGRRQRSRAPILLSQRPHSPGTDEADACTRTLRARGLTAPNALLGACGAGNWISAPAQS